MPGKVAPPQPMAERPAAEQAFWCGVFGAGVIGMLVLYGVLQERIMTLPYAGPDGSTIFHYSVFLIFLNRLGAVVFALFMAVYRKEGLGNSVPIWKYLVVSMSNVLASTCQYEALKYVSFAVQMLGKSFKMMPVMVWGIAISGKTYSWKDWMIAAAVTGGVTEFLMTGPTNPSNSHGNSAHGMVLLGLFLAFDGLTSTMQEKLFTEHKTSKYNQLMYVNGLSAVVSAFTLLTTGTFFPAFNFFFTHGRFAIDAVALTVSAVGGQFFIYSQVQSFGALVLAATMNARQVVSILVSYLTYHHHITALQVLGLGIVFAALFYKSSASARAAEKAEMATLKPSAHDGGYQAVAEKA